jgi:hypothetical protein
VASDRGARCGPNAPTNVCLSSRRRV